MKTRKCDFLNTKTLKPVFGFQVFSEGRWRYVALDGKPFVFDTEAQRDQKLADFRKAKLVAA